jgi:hypothetical protein
MGKISSQDLTQGFFLHLLEHHGLTQVDPDKGKFRSVLLASLQNFLATVQRRERTGRTVTEPAAIDEEVHLLCEALVAAENHLAQ